MNEDLDSFYEGLSYDEGFGPSEVKVTIAGATSSTERKSIFGEDRDLSPYCHFLRGLFLYLQITWLP